MKVPSALLPLAVLGSVVATRVAAPTTAPDPAVLSGAFRELVRDVGPAVVGVRAVRMEDGRQATSVGSGVVLRADGVVVTNHHVVRDATHVQVQIDEDHSLPARVVGVDPETDLAVLDVAGNDHTCASLGADDPPEVGDWVLAVGNPYGLGRAVSAGIVSGLRRSLDIAVYEDFIQTDAAINSGNSGGALFDLDGRVVGINTAKGTLYAGSVGMGFAIPAHIVRDVVDQLLERGRVRRGWLGVGMVGLTPAGARGLGLGPRRHVVVTEVFRDGPAAQAGVHVDDVILRIGNHEPIDLPDLLLTVARLQPGTQVPLEVWRDGARCSLKVEMGEREPPDTRAPE